MFVESLGVVRYKREGGWCYLSYFFSNFLVDNDFGYYFLILVCYLILIVKYCSCFI